MIGNVKLIWAAALGLAAAILPFSAHAGTSTSTGTVSMIIEPSGCEVAGANINLGTYQANQTWYTVARRLGYITRDMQWVTGTMGDEYVNYGTVICDSGVPYTLAITGSASSSDNMGWLPVQGAVRLSFGNGVSVYLLQTVKTLDGKIVEHNNWGGMGQTMTGGTTISGVGTGNVQQIRGHMVLSVDVNKNSPVYGSTTQIPAGTPALESRIGAPDQMGTWILMDTLTYTLTF